MWYFIGCQLKRRHDIEVIKMEKHQPSNKSDPIKFFLKTVYWSMIGAIGLSAVYLAFEAYLVWFYKN